MKPEKNMKPAKGMTVILLATVLIVLVGGGLTVAYMTGRSNGSVSNDSISNGSMSNYSIQSYNASDNNRTVLINPGETLEITLNQNPATGYAWIINTTPGLSVVNSTYIPPPSGRMGAGVQEWQIKATGTGDQQITGIYKRSWEPTTGNETTYTINIRIA